MNAYFDRLMVHIPNGYTKAPNEVPALQLNGQGAVSIQGDHLYITSGSSSATIDLHGQSIENIVSQFPSGVTATVLQNNMAELLMIPEGQTWAQLPVTLNIPSNPLWYVIGWMARTLESRRRSLQAQVAQINLASAAGRLLNWWGASLGVTRLPGEPDPLYAQRIMGLRFQPNVNNYAMQQFFSSLGYETTVQDTGYGQASVQVNLPTSPPTWFVYSLEQLQTALQSVKAAGVIMTVVLNGQMQDTVQVTDSISSSLATYPWTVGNVTVGQFSV
ncbi:hypothetical protein [Alicyclobacillus sendaiensis]|uniref:hypothetical protein n=1 Tax=Alicyclobacillus sendaiensis TaxID=192387 RepID=UPI0026F441F5|nr:hypothetical protein [Alicyclobacillus sendaiensis]